MMKPLLAAAAAAALLSSAAFAQDKPKIGLIQIDLSNPFHLGRSRRRQGSRAAR